MQTDVQAWRGRVYLYGILTVLLSQPPQFEWLKGVFGPILGQIIRALGLSERLVNITNEIEQVLSNENVDTSWLQNAEAEYYRLFTVPVNGEMVSLGASSYLPENELDRRRIEWEELYERFGFAWRNLFNDTSGVWPNESEHVVLILPILAILSDEIIQSIESEDEFTSALQRVYNTALRRAHDWLPICFTTIQQKSRHPLYIFLGEMAESVIRMDYELI